MHTNNIKEYKNIKKTLYSCEVCNQQFYHEEDLKLHRINHWVEDVNVQPRETHEILVKIPLVLLSENLQRNLSNINVHDKHSSESDEVFIPDGPIKSPFLDPNFVPSPAMSYQLRSKAKASNGEGALSKREGACRDSLKSEPDPYDRAEQVNPSPNPSMNPSVLLDKRLADQVLDLTNQGISVDYNSLKPTNMKHFWRPFKSPISGNFVDDYVIWRVALV